MAIDDSKLLYSSEWDIDQIYIHDTVTLSLPDGSGTPTTTSTIISVPNVTNAVVDVTYKPQGETSWHQAFLPNVVVNFWQFIIGATHIYPNTADKTGGVTVWWRVDGGSLTLYAKNLATAKTVDIRYYIWTESIVQ